MRCESGSLAQNFQRVRGMISPGMTRARTQGPAHLEERRRGKRWPQCETSISKCAPGVRVQRTFIFSPASYSSPGTFEAVVGWYGFALVSTLVCLLIQYNRAVEALMRGRCYWHTPRGARAHMTPTSLCMICAANHIMRFPDRPAFLFSQLCKEPVFGKYLKDRRIASQWGRLHVLIYFKRKLVSAWLVQKASGQEDSEGPYGGVLRMQRFPLAWFLFMQRCQRTPGSKAISYSLSSLLHPIFTYCLILSLGATADCLASVGRISRGVHVSFFEYLSLS